MNNLDSYLGDLFRKQIQYEEMKRHKTKISLVVL